MAARDIKSSWADDSDDDQRPAPEPAWKGWGAPKAAPKVEEEVKKPALPEQDYPTLNGGGRSARRPEQPSDRNGNDSHRGEDRKGGDYDRRDNYDNRRGGDYGSDRRDSYGDRREGGFGERRDQAPRDFGGDRRDSYGDRREGGYGDRREGGYGGERREGGYGGERRESYGRRADDYGRDDRRDSYDRRDNQGFRGGERRDDREERSDNWRDRPEGGEGDRFGRDSRERSDFRGRGDREFNRDRPQRAPRPKLPLPTSPPYIAYIGNLDFNIEPKDINEFFDCDCEVRLMTFPDTNKPRGYGYVTFQDLASLEAALAREGEILMGREIKVDVSEGPRQPRETSSNWGRDRENRENRESRESREREPEKETRETPAERPKLNIAPRTVVAEPSPSDEDSKSPSQPKANPFGDAKPRDQLAIQKAFEERQREKERLEKEKAEKEKTPEREEVRKPAFDRKDAPRRDERPTSSSVGPRAGGDRPREFNRDRPREFNRDRDNRDNRDSRDNRDNRTSRPEHAREAPKPHAPSAAPASKDTTKPKVPAPAPAKDKKPAKKEVANKFAVLNLSETECP